MFVKEARSRCSSSYPALIDVQNIYSKMPSTTPLDTVRDELFQCLENSQVAKKVSGKGVAFTYSILILDILMQDNLSGKEVLALPTESFPVECEALKKAFDDCVEKVVSN